MGNSERSLYEQRVAQTFTDWRQQIDHLRARATGRNMPGTVGSEIDEVAKLQGQLEMAQVQFDELCAVDKAGAWQDLQIGVDKKLTELHEQLERTRAQIEGAN